MSYEPRRLPWQEDIEVRGLRHRLTWWGARTSTPIVLLHGFQDSGATWQFLVDCLPPEWTFVAPDWRGFGDTEWAPGGYWFPDYLADLEVLLDILVPQSRARVIGHSMGANVAKMYGGIRPARLQWLVNLEGLGLARTQPEEAPQRYARWLDEIRGPLKERPYKSVNELAALLQLRNPHLRQPIAEFLARAWSKPVPPEPAAGNARPSSQVQLRFDPRHRFVNPILYHREEAEACWARLEAPMLLVMGELSNLRTRYLPHVTDEDWHALFKRVRIVTIPDTGHMMHHEDPESVARHIIEFERDCAASAL